MEKRKSLSDYAVLIPPQSESRSSPSHLDLEEVAKSLGVSSNVPPCKKPTAYTTIPYDVDRTRAKWGRPV